MSGFKADFVADLCCSRSDLGSKNETFSRFESNQMPLSFASSTALLASSGSSNQTNPFHWETSFTSPFTSTFFVRILTLAIEP